MGSYTETITITEPRSPSQLFKTKSNITVEEADLDLEPPFKRTSTSPIEKLPGSLPSANISPEVDHAAAVEYCLQYLNKFTEKALADDAIFRDIYALTGTVRTFNTSKNISSVWRELASYHHPSGFALIPDSSQVVRMPGGYSWIQARFSFNTSGVPAAKCSGQIGLVPDAQFGWKIWLLTTILEEIDGFANPDWVTPEAMSAVLRATNPAADFDCVIIGAGFAGLCLAGRLKAMGVKYVNLEKNDNIGDGWRNRYHSARFHTTKYYSDMPLGAVFGDDYDYFPSAQDLARGYEEYARRHQINVQLSTALTRASYDKKENVWTLQTDRKGEHSTLRTTHLVFAIGAGGTIPKTPELPGREIFKGTALHSVDYKNAHAWKGKKGVIVGTGNTAHDVAEDMLEAGLESTTMIQRGRTSVFPIEYYRMWSDPLYNATSGVEDADRQVMAMPIVVTRWASLIGNSALADTEPDRFDALERAGFRVDRHGDLWKLLSERLGGHYMDVGASKKIADGLIKIKGDAALTGYTEHGVKFSDGSELETDIVLFCTGFSHNVRGQVIQFVGPEVGEKLDEYWELDDEGELRGVYKPHGIHGIWYTGGGVTYARFYSRFLALQIKADVCGTPLNLYKKRPQDSAIVGQ